MSKRFKVDKEQYQALLKKYPGAEKIIKDTTKTADDLFNKKPGSFELREGKYFINHVKEFLQFEDSTLDSELILKTSYQSLIKILKRYVDVREEYYSFIALWIIGTYLHNEFPTYPFLFLNAMKGSGKTRLLKLITVLSKEGDLLNSLSEAVLFRTSGTLGIDEFEGITRKGGENLRELLNAAYKKGSRVKRMRKKSGPDGEEQVVEEFDVYRAICMANIWGMESVLGDRCITIILERSSNKTITRMMELFDLDNDILEVKKSLIKCRLCHVVTPGKVYREWNKYVTHNDITTHTPNDTNDTMTSEIQTLFNKINESEMNGRHLELAMPFLIIADNIGLKCLDNTLEVLIKIMESKKEDDFSDNHDVSLIDFISQMPTPTSFISMNSLTKQFQEFIQDHAEWLNTKWMGRALKRLALVKKKRRYSRGREVVLNIEKAQERIKMFK